MAWYSVKVQGQLYLYLLLSNQSKPKTDFAHEILTGRICRATRHGLRPSVRLRHLSQETLRPTAVLSTYRIVENRMHLPPSGLYSNYDKRLVCTSVLYTIY